MQILLWYILTFIAGAFFGSFYNLVSDRSVDGRKVLTGRSVCDFCKKKLESKELIPILSFLMQGGKCSSCKKKLSFYYPLSEILTGFLFVLSAYLSDVFTDFSSPNILVFLYFATVFSFYLILFLTDVKYRLLPNKIIYPAIIVTTLFVIFLTVFDLKMYYDELLTSTFGKYLIAAGLWRNTIINTFKRFIVLIASSGLISLFFLMLIWVTKGRGMGGGDVKLGFLIGIFNGFPNNILAIFLGFIIGAIYSLVLILFRKKSIKDTIAFGPFLIIGSLIGMIWGSLIIDWYINFL